MKKTILLLFFALSTQLTIAQDEFITIWEVSDFIPILTLPSQPYAISYTIDWGDGTTDLTVYTTGSPTHTYANGGEYEISMTGNFPELRFQNQTQLKGVKQWGTQKWKFMHNMFRDCINFNILPESAPDLSLISAMSHMFRGATSFNQDIGNWDVSNANEMAAMFNGATSFNQDIGNWNVGKVSNMNEMFYGATLFNQDIGNWNVENVTEMFGMFQGATSFNQNIGEWNVSKVVYMNNMFDGVTFSTKNYDALLNGWPNTAANNGNSLNSGLFFSGGNSTYCNGEGARNYLINDLGWTITDGGLDCSALDDFITIWEVDDSNTILTLPAQSDAISYTIDWGDGTTDSTVYTTQSPSHTYTAGGEYNISMTGDYPHLTFVDQLQLKGVKQWGTQKWTSMARMFEGCENFNMLPTGAPDLTKANDLSRMFYFAISFNQYIENWDVSNITSLNSMFRGATSFNQPIGNWNISNVIDMEGLFGSAISFNQYIGDWDVGKVTNMKVMFQAATSFNQDIGKWNVSNVKTMNSMFSSATSFNKYIGDWDVSNLTNAQAMFIGATSFNQDIEKWNVENVTNMLYMFYGATSFNQPLGNWNVSNVTRIEWMFREATSFNQDIGNWDVGNAISLSNMFKEAISFNQDIGNWDVSNIVGMTKMFEGATSFNQDIGNWNVSNVTQMRDMFNGATSFNQDISSWDVSKVEYMDDMFLNVTLSTENYDVLLIGWPATAASNGVTLKSNVTFSGGNSNYCNGEDARDYLTETLGWTITDGGLDCSTLSLDDLDTGLISIYPNPTSASLNIRITPELLNESYKIYDVLGKTMHEGILSSDQTNINVENLSNGIYFISLGNNKASKFIKQ